MKRFLVKAREVFLKYVCLQLLFCGFLGAMYFSKQKTERDNETTAIQEHKEEGDVEMGLLMGLLEQPESPEEKTHPTATRKKKRRQRIFSER